MVPCCLFRKDPPILIPSDAILVRSNGTIVSYVAQARSTEVVARGNYFKARAALDRSLGSSIEKYNICVAGNEAFKWDQRAPPTTPIT